MKIKSLAIFFFLILTGCSASYEAPPKEPLPDWVLNQPTGDPRYFYGTGNHSNKTRAVELALKEVASFISINIKSTSTAQSFKSGLSTNSSFSENIQSEVQKIEFSNYEIENQALVNNKNYIRVRVLKSSVTENTQNKFNDLDRKNTSQIALAESQEKLPKLFALKKAEKNLTEAYNLLILLRSLKQFDAFAELDEDTVSSNLLRYEGYFNAYNTLLTQIRFTVQAEPDMLPIAKALSASLSEQGIKNAINSGQESADGVIIVGGKVETGTVQSYKAATYYADISLQQNGKSLSSVSKKIIGYSVQSHDGAAENASAKFLEEIKKEGVLKMLKL